MGRMPLLALAVLVVAAMPARAGSEQDPEITDPCGGLPPLMEEADICSGWFEGLWTLPEAGDPTWPEATFEGLQTTLKIATDISHEPAHVTYAMGWDIGPCHIGWVSRFLADTHERVGLFRSQCAGEDQTTIPLPPERLVFEGDLITVRLMLDDELGHLAELFFVGQELTAPVAKTWFAVHTSTSPSFVFTVEGDWTYPGRTFVIGQDRPDTP